MEKRIFAPIILLFFLLNFTLNLKAQTDISMSTHWSNRASYNPAFIARSGYVYLFSNARRQWENVAGAPATFNVQASGYINNLNSAVGLSLVSDQIGLTTSLNPMLTYAYKISDGANWSLSMGLSAGVFSRTIDGSLFDPVTSIDPSLYNNELKILNPDANFGLEFQSAHYIFGASTTHLFAIGKPETLFLNSNHRYAYAIYKNNDSQVINYDFRFQVANRYNLTYFELNSGVKFKHPTGLTTGPREMLSFGLTYRTTQQLILLFGVNISPNFRIGYAYDQSFHPGYSLNATNEIMLEYRIPVKDNSSCILCKRSTDWYD